MHAEAHAAAGLLSTLFQKFKLWGRTRVEDLLQVEPIRLVYGDLPQVGGAPGLAPRRDGYQSSRVSGRRARESTTFKNVMQMPFFLLGRMESGSAELFSRANACVELYFRS